MKPSVPNMIKLLLESVFPLPPSHLKEKEADKLIQPYNLTDMFISGSYYNVDRRAFFLHKPETDGLSLRWSVQSEMPAAARPLQTRCQMSLPSVFYVIGVTSPRVQILKRRCLTRNGQRA